MIKTIVNIISIVTIFVMANMAFAGQTVSTPTRIVSLAPSITEILFAMGLGDNIVGVTSFCDQPEAAKAKKKIGGMSNPSLEAVVLLKPDIVVMTTDGNPKEFELRLRTLNIRTYVFTARRIKELPKGIRELGVELGARGKANALAQEIEIALSKSGSRGKEHGDRGQGSGGSRVVKNPELFTPLEVGRVVPPRILTGQAPHSELNKTKVLFIVWPEPLIVAGRKTAMDDAITLLGYQNIASGAKSTYPKYSLEEVIRQAPDVICIGKGSGMDMRAVSQGILKRLKTVPAVKNGKICYLSDSLYRLGPRVIEGIEELAECLK